MLIVGDLVCGMIQDTMVAKRSGIPQQRSNSDGSIAEGLLKLILRMWPFKTPMKPLLAVRAASISASVGILGVRVDVNDSHMTRIRLWRSKRETSIIVIEVAYDSKI